MDVDPVYSDDFDSQDELESNGTENNHLSSECGDDDENELGVLDEITNSHQNNVDGKDHMSENSLGSQDYSVGSQGEIHEDNIDDEDHLDDDEDNIGDDEDNIGDDDDIGDEENHIDDVDHTDDDENIDDDDNIDEDGLINEDDLNEEDNIDDLEGEDHVNEDQLEDENDNIDEEEDYIENDNIDEEEDHLDNGEDHLDDDEELLASSGSEAGEMIEENSTAELQDSSSHGSPESLDEVVGDGKNEIEVIDLDSNSELSVPTKERDSKLKEKVESEESNHLDAKSPDNEVKEADSESDLTDKADNSSDEDSDVISENGALEDDAKEKSEGSSEVEEDSKADDDTHEKAVPENVDKEQPQESSTSQQPKEASKSSCDENDSANKELSKSPATETNAENVQSEAVDLSKTSPSKVKEGGAKTPPAEDSRWVKLNKKDIGFPDAFEGEVTIGRYMHVTGDFVLTSSNALLECPSSVSPFLVKELDTFPEREQPLEPPTDLFQSSIGKFLMGLGLSRVNEWYFRDMVNIKMKQIRKDGKQPQLEEDMKALQTMYSQAKLANKPYKFNRKTCSICGFVTESDGVLDGHLLIPHTTPYREYKCSYCLYLHRDSREMLKHMKTSHDKTGKIEIPPQLYECINCDFECGSKVKFGIHWNKCSKHFNPNSVQTPPYSFEFPCLSPKPITVAGVRQHQKSSHSSQNIQGKSKNMQAFPFGPQTQRVGVPDQRAVSGISHKNSMLVQTAAQRGMSTNLVQLQGMLNNPCFQVPNSDTLGNTLRYPQQPQHLKPNASQIKVTFPPRLPQLPKLLGPFPVPNNPTTSASSLVTNYSSKPDSLVVCEICDGFIKDLEQLKTHMQLIHKVKLHPRVLASRPPLNCQKCYWRFFTDQGLERHLLGVHGLVTANMQEQANKGRDAGCCTVCGRVFVSKLVAHMSQVHKIPLKPAHLSYKCTMCSASFNLYRLFENHVFQIHHNASKRPADNSNQGLPTKRVAKKSSWQKSTNKQRNVAGKVNGDS